MCSLLLNQQSLMQFYWISHITLQENRTRYIKYSLYSRSAYFLFWWEIKGHRYVLLWVNEDQKKTAANQDSCLHLPAFTEKFDEKHSYGLNMWWMTCGASVPSPVEMGCWTGRLWSFLIVKIAYCNYALSSAAVKYTEVWQASQPFVEKLKPAQSHRPSYLTS